MRARVVGGLVAIAVAVTPAVATAQSSPTAPPFPTMPWVGITTPYGQFIRFVYVPPQPVTLQYIVQGPSETALPAEPPSPSADGDRPAEEPPTPETAAPTPSLPQVVRLEVVLPGYHVRETTAGYYYPERWSIEQTGLNAYRWRKLPAQFVPW